MNGENTSQKNYEILISRQQLASWVEGLRENFQLIGPVGVKDEAEFREVFSFDEINPGYRSTMLPPGKTFLLKPEEEILSFDITPEGPVAKEPPLPHQKRVLFGVHACDTHAILYLDKVFLGAFPDPLYRARRENTLIISLNCRAVTEFCFCHLVGAGPFLKAQSGYDVLLTDMDGEFLVELKSERARKLFRIEGRPPEEKDWKRKEEMELELLKSFSKDFRADGLREVFLSRPDHPALRETAEGRCLSCANCVMVCPTCFCHDIYDETRVSRTGIKRMRRWDACQDYSFARVHGGNFRQERQARLRQFVFHKLDYEGQFGVKGTVGCGRCIRWCPTGIDLTEIAKEMMK
ncbi:MAG: 4Fe-4S dicluster domain-containing protein [Nitrospiraceae bacterium]|nr:4Fe-4S dicluster domain-containing protein [Nitrospiraceae bacterium]